MTLKGTIKRSDLEGGHWTFETDGGDTYQLEGELGAAKDNLRAEVEGNVDKGGFGIQMTGPKFVVKKLKAL